LKIYNLNMWMTRLKLCETPTKDMMN